MRGGRRTYSAARGRQGVRAALTDRSATHHICPRRRRSSRALFPRTWSHQARGGRHVASRFGRVRGVRVAARPPGGGTTHRYHRGRWVPALHRLRQQPEHQQHARLRRTPRRVPHPPRLGRGRGLHDVHRLGTEPRRQAHPVTSLRRLQPPRRRPGRHRDRHRLRAQQVLRRHQLHRQRRRRPRGRALPLPRSARPAPRRQRGLHAVPREQEPQRLVQRQPRPAARRQCHAQCDEEMRRCRMRSSSTVWLTVAVGCSALLSGCGGKDSTGPVTPKAVAVVSGNGQTGPGGDDLPDSLRVVVTGSNNQPMAGVSVTWAAGGASVSPLTNRTDANGQSAARLSLGAVGPVLVTASVAGLASATFTATAVDPCTWLHVFGVGQTVNGILRQYDCVSNLYFIDYYDLPVSGQQTLAVTMVSNTFDTWLDVWKLAGPYVGANDDDMLSTNSLFKVVAAGGEYVIGANTYNAGDTGPYTLHATTTSPSEEHCEEVWLTRG